MREVIIDFSEDSVVGGKQWEHNASELVITVKEELLGALEYYLEFVVAGEKTKSNIFYSHPIRYVLCRSLTKEVRCSVQVVAVFETKVLRSNKVYISFEVSPNGKEISDFMCEALNNIEDVENRVEKVENLIKSITSFSKDSLGKGLDIDESGKVYVAVADKVEEGNHNPISSDAVYQEVGNINALLEQI